MVEGSTATSAMRRHHSVTGREAHQDAFEEEYGKEGAEDAAADVKDIVVGGVDGGQPDAERYDSQDALPRAAAMDDERIDERHKGVG